MGAELAERTASTGESEMTREPLWKVAEVAQYLGVSIGTIYHLTSQKRIPCLRLSARCLRFEPMEIESWLRSGTEHGTMARIEKGLERNSKNIQKERS